MRIAVVGTGVVGSILGGHLLKSGADAALVDANPERVAGLKRLGLNVSDPKSFISGDLSVSVPRACASLGELRGAPPDVLFLCVKACALEEVLPDVKAIHAPGMRVVSFQNGLGTEELVASALGTRRGVLRVVINYAGRILDQATVGVGFFNRPNYIGVLDPADEGASRELAELLTAAGLETRATERIAFHVWEKVILNSALCAICALTDLTISAVMELPRLRAVAGAVIREGMAVAGAEGVGFPEGFFESCIAYLEKAGPHKPSMCSDCEGRRKTEIDFLNGMIAERGRRSGVSAVHNEILTALVKGVERHIRGADGGSTRPEAAPAGRPA